MSAASGTVEITYKVPQRRHPVLAFALQQPLGTTGMAVIVLMILAAVFAKWVAPHDPLTVDYGGILAPPSWNHLLGTDNFGRDVFSRIIYGSRTALAVGFLSSLIGSTLGAIIGVASAYFGGRTDMIIQRFMDIILAFPIIVLALAVVAVLGKNVVFGIDWNLIIAIGLPMVPKVARVVRSSALAVREMPYIDAARTAGFSTSWTAAGFRFTASCEFARVSGSCTSAPARASRRPPRRAAPGRLRSGSRPAGPANPS